MRFKTIATMAAVAFALAVGSDARAAFNFTVSAAADPLFFTDPGAQGPNTGITSGTAVLSSGPVVTLPTSGIISAAVPGIDINFANPTVTDSGATATPVVFHYGYDVTITDVASSQSTTVLVTGTIGGLSSATGSNLTAFGFAAAPTSATLGGALYTFTESLQGTGTAPNVNAGAGSLVLHVTATVVPEPASIALMGLGTLGVVGLVRRRRAAKA